MMRKFQRAVVVAAAVAGLSTLGVGVSFAHDGGFGGVTAADNGQQHGQQQGRDDGPGNGRDQGRDNGQEQGQDQGRDDGQEQGPDNGDGD
uniref:Uncharacterized protein n=1 Tax=Streptomyces sp. NBC_00003 TaxID=2903608 RepID=A0AAU2VGH3_9ACTN